MALRCAISKGRVSSTVFATAEASILVLPSVLVQEGPFSPRDTASSDSVMALRCAIPKGRASSTVFATAEASALIVPLVLHQEGPSFNRRHCEFRILSWRCGLRHEEAGLHQQSLRLLQRWRWSCLFLAKETQLHQKTVRFWISSRHSALQFQEAEFRQQTLQLLWRRRWAARKTLLSPGGTASSTTIFGTSTNCSIICGSGRPKNGFPFLENSHTSTNCCTKRC